MILLIDSVNLKFIIFLITNKNLESSDFLMQLVCSRVSEDNVTNWVPCFREEREIAFILLEVVNLRSWLLRYSQWI